VPELPEVETVARDLRRAGLIGRAVRRVDIRWPRTVAPLDPARFRDALRRQTFTALRRRAKYLVFHLSGGADLLVHLRMTGQFHWLASDQAPDPHDRLILTLDDGRRLGFRDTRKFGRWTLVPNAETHLAHLGPEPLHRTFSPRLLHDRLAGRLGRLKSLLLDQRCVAGLGNIYADEALWAARLHPERRAASLTPPEIRALHRAIRAVLRLGVRNRGTSLGAGKTNYTTPDSRPGRNQNAVQVFRRTHAPCPACGTPIRRILVGQRSTHFCPRCQREAPPGPFA